MTFITNWEEFEKSAEMLYLRDPINTRYSTKYSHSKGVFLAKITDNKKHAHVEVHLAVLLASKVSITCILWTLSIFPIVLWFSLHFKQFQCLQYKTEVQQDVRKIDKFMSNLMRHMASNDN